MIRRPPRSTRKESSAASDVYKRQTSHTAISSPKSSLPKHGTSSIFSPSSTPSLRGLRSSKRDRSSSMLSSCSSSAEQFQCSSCVCFSVASVVAVLSLSLEWPLEGFCTCLLYTSPSPRD
eukprot:TRINITY_DN6351_c0_g1_i5.p1 TRINITY_DN6351_c0_g1~~TRINITY_DN6351_c0_g1_i5.p1  ORF type:complete len:129 (+),score=19.32 TRINITY_DN6351_c0_g1_i5:30-389(+)